MSGGIPLIGGSPVSALTGMAVGRGAMAVVGKGMRAVGDKIVSIVSGTVLSDSVTLGQTLVGLDTAPLEPVPARSICGPVPKGARVILLQYPPRGLLVLGVADSQTTSIVRFLTVGTFTYTKPVGLISAKIRVQGGGGGGGGAAATGVGQSSGGSGGQAGHYTETFLTAAQIPSATTVVIGPGGVGASGADGTVGSQSSFGLVTAGGGDPGLADAAGVLLAIGLTGGRGNYVGASGLLGIKGEDGWPGYRLAADIYLPGRGGSGPFGTSHSALAPTGNLQGQAGDRGSGGGGSSRRASVGALAGGNGGSGVVVVEQYFR